MALPGNPSADIMALINAGIPQQDPKQQAMLLAIQNAMGQRVKQAPIMSQVGAPATDSEIGDHAGEMISAMTPRDEQPNYNNRGFDPYVKFPEADVPEEGIRGPGVEAPYREDRGDMIDRRGSYEQQPGEDKAARMAQDAVEGKGTTYPSKSGNEMLRDATRRGGGDPNGDWEGSPDGVPTKGDLEAVQESPTDGNLASFFRAFPKYTMEDVMMRGGNPSGSPDEYAMSDEDFQRLNRRRRTTIENR